MMNHLITILVIAVFVVVVASGAFSLPESVIAILLGAAALEIGISRYDAIFVMVQVWRGQA